jgi:endonuclease YncB( thermonuclease family)
MLTFRSRLVLVLAAGLPAAQLFAGGAGAAPGLAGAARVVDGDTLDIAGTRVRLFGIDAPEAGQPCDRAGAAQDCGAWAAAMLARAIGTSPVACTPLDRDRYGRTVASCTAQGRDLGAVMVAAGAARAYARYSDAYLAEERAARDAGLGLWSARMTSPEAHRAAARGPDTPAPDPGCALKGNVSANGHIYHSPGQADYDRVRIDPARGEGWFCSAAEARAAGFRPARR